jgi:hypothetical protein
MHYNQVQQLRNFSGKPKTPEHQMEIIIQHFFVFTEGFKKFKKDFGHSTAFSLQETLWTCQNMFSNRYYCKFKLSL